MYGLFQPSVLGMESQSHALEAIATNITNVRTGGYKRTDVEFATVLSRTVSSQPGSGAAPAGTNHADFGGVRPIDHARVSLQGEIVATQRELDVALNGRGYFVFNTDADGSGNEVYGRDGRFEVLPAGADALSLSGGHIVDKNGYYVQGWAAAPDGTLPAPSSSAESLWLDPNLMSAGQPTTASTLGLNLPAQNEAGAVETYAIDVFDSTGGQRGLELAFTRSATANVWDFDVVGAAGDTVSVLPQTTVAGVPVNQPLVFEPDGYLQGPAAYAVSVAHADGTTSGFTLDVSRMTQFAGPFLPVTYEHDGFPPGELEALEFDSRGRLSGRFGNGQVRVLYQLALADFNNADGLAALSGNVYTLSELSGAPQYGAPGAGKFAAAMPAAHELSNVDLAEEFTRMIKTQNAYNASATSFRTVDEMTEVARDLKA